MSSQQFNPYVGLRPFQAEENLLFFGRDTQTLELLQRLHEHRFVAVVGGSGSGKSSLIRAGLIPALKGGYLIEDSRKWVVYTMKPGQSAMFNLAKSILSQINSEATISEINQLVIQIKREGINAILNRLHELKNEQGGNFFLLVDQFEELFRFASEQHNASKKTDAIDFVNTILSLTKQNALPFYVVLTMRSDFIGDCAKFRDLPEAMNKSQYLVPRLTRQQLKTVIEGPSKLYGKKFDATLTSRLINDLEKVKDELPLVQHALMRMWNHEVNISKNGILDFEDYKAVGGIENALSKHAEEAIKDMNNADLGIAKELFQALTAVDENGRKIRRPLLLSDLRALTGVDDEHLLRIIHQFIEDQRSFLIVESTSNGQDKVIDISHESLIRQWDTLHQWVDEEAESASFYLQLAEAHRLHKSGKKDYLTGSELQLALDWREKFKPTSVWANRYKPGYEESMAYLAESNQEFIRLQNIEKSRRKKQRILVFTIMALIGLFAAYAVIERNKAQLREIEANNKKNAFELHFQSKVLETNDPTTALRLEEEALKLYDYHEFRKSALSLINSHSFYKIIDHTPNYYNDFDISSGNNRVFGHQDGTVRITSQSGELIGEYMSPHPFTSVDFAPDGQSIIASTFEKILLLDLNGKLLKEFKTPNIYVNSAAFSPDGLFIVSGSGDHKLRLWSLEGNLVKEFIGHTQIINTVAFAPNGQSVLSGSADKTARLWSIDGELMHVFNQHLGEVYDVAYAPDNNTILTGSWEGIGRLWTLDGVLKKEFRGHWGSILSLGFSPDGQSIITGSFDNTARVWNLDGIMLKELTGHSREINSVAFKGDGKSVLTGSKDGTLRSWNLYGAIDGKFEGFSGAVRSAKFSQDEKSMLISSYQNVQWLELDGTLKQKFEVPRQGMIYSAVFSPDGQYIVTGSAKGNATLWDINGNTLQDFEGPPRSNVRSVAFTPDGKGIITAHSRDGLVRLWDLKANVLKEYETGSISSAAISHDGKSIIASGFGKTVLWDLDGTQLAEFKEPKGLLVNDAKFSPDDQYILTGSNDHGARLWNRKGELLREFKGPRGAIRSVAFSNDGKIVATGAAGGVIRLWDLNGNIISELQTNPNTVFTMEFSDDDRSILIGTGTSVFRMNLIQLDEFLRGPIEGLSEEQKREYGIE